MMKESIIMIFGEYTPVVYTLADGTVTTGVDWSYIGAVVLFSICLWSAFRLLGLVLSK